MSVIVCFIYVWMDKYTQATEKIQAQELESFFVAHVSIVTFVLLSFSNVYVCIS